MATLTGSDYAELRNEFLRSGWGKDEVKSELGVLGKPSQPELLAAFQSIENDMLSVSPTIKANFDAAIGGATSNALFKMAMRVWFRWRDRRGG